MRKKDTLALVAAGLIACGATANADSYTYDFNETLSITSNSHNLPKGWDHMASAYIAEGWYDYDYFYPTYTYLSTGGIDDSGALKIGDQTELGNYNDSGPTHDLIITPMVSGTIKLKVKSSASTTTDASFVEFYKMTLNGTKWSKGDKITVDNASDLVNMTSSDLNNSEFVELSFTLPETCHLGLRCSQVIIDDFYAQEKVAKAHASIISVTNKTPGGTSPLCNENNEFTVTTEVKIRNDGDVTLTPSTEGMYVAIATAKNYAGAEVVTFEPYVYLDENLDPEQEVTLTASAIIPLSGARGEYDAMTSFPCGAYLPLADQFMMYTGWTEPKPYVPEFKFRNANDNLVSDAQNFGRVHQNDEIEARTFKIANTGAAPLEITEVTCPDGFIIEGMPETPFTVASGSNQTFTIALDTSEPKSVSSNLVIKGNGMEDFSLLFSGIVLDPTKWSADFEDQWLPSVKQMPDGVYAEDGWSLKDYSSSGSKCAAYYSINDLTKHDYFVTPLLQFDENESFAFDLSRINTSSAMDVYYSTDRRNWTLLKEIPNSDITTQKEGSGYSSSYKYSSFAVSLPAGQYYIGFDANYCYLDNLYGGTKVEVTHDLMVNTVSIPASGMVNYDYVAKGSLQNILANDETVKITLMVNDEAVAETEVSVESQAKAVAFELAFLSNEVIEDAKARFILNVDDYSAESPEWNIYIRAEELNSEAVTPHEASTTNSSGPWASNYTHTQTRIVYPEAFIPVSAGTRISGIKFYGYNTSSAVPTVSAWMCHTDAETAAKENVDTEGMTQVVEAKEITPVKIGSYSDSNHEILYIPFDDSFTYNGGNLELYITLDATWNSGFNARLISDSAASNCQSSRRSDSDVNTATWSNYNLPVTGFTYEAEPMELTGIVTGEKKAGEGDSIIEVNVDGAVVILTEYTEQETPEVTDPETPENQDDNTTESHRRDTPAKRVVSYSTTTDETGAYTLPVLQADKVYTLTVKHPDFSDYNHDETISLADGSKELNVKMKTLQSGIYGITYEKESKGVFSINGILLDKKVNELEPGVYVINGKKVVVTRK